MWEPEFQCHCKLPSGEKKMPHILAIPFPAQGHINPLLQVCKWLASQGITLTFVNMDIIQQRMQECSTTTDHGSNLSMAHLPLAGLDLSHGFGVSLEDMVKAMENTADALLHLITRLSVEGNPVTCILSDLMLTSWTARLAHLLNLPHFTFFTSSQSVNLFMTYLPSLISQGFFSLQDAIDGFPDSKEKALPHLAGLPPLLLRDIPTFRHAANDTEFLYSYFEKQYQQVLKSDGVLCNTFYELEKAAIDTMAQHVRVYPVGPLFIASTTAGSLWTEEDHCLQWLDKQAAACVVYISFGSLTFLSAPQFEEIVLGLEASKHPFLWALRPDLVKTSDGSYNPVEFIKGRVGDSMGYVVSWSPQLQVLSHPAVGGFLSHCGWNSTLESIGNGVPMLCWPYFADQMMDSRFIVSEWKVGIEFEGRSEGFVTKEEVKRVVKEVMEGDAGIEMRQRVAKVKEEAHNSMMDEGHSYSSLLAFVSDLEVSLPL